MAFTYQFGANPAIDFPRLLIGDTVDLNHVFEDAEITAAATICSSIRQSGGRYSSDVGATLPAGALSYFRVAALLLDALASNRARLSISKLKDANVDFAKTSAALRDQANQWRTIDDESGAFALITLRNGRVSGGGLFDAMTGTFDETPGVFDEQ